jgi:hypothetical protein
MLFRDKYSYKRRETTKFEFHYSIFNFVKLLKFIRPGDRLIPRPTVLLTGSYIHSFQINSEMETGQRNKNEKKLKIYLVTLPQVFWESV